MPAASASYSFRNSSTDTVVAVEPWGEEIPFPNGSMLSLTVFHEEPGILETEITPKALVLYAWGSCTAKVLLNGSDVTPPFLTHTTPPGEGGFLVRFLRSREDGIKRQE